MRISRVLILLAAVFLGVYLIPKWLVTDPYEKERKDEYVTKRLELIKAEINRVVRDRACVKEGPFPYSSRVTRRGCKRCEDLYQAGLLTKTVDKYDDYIGAIRTVRHDTRYELTEFGRSVYFEGTSEHPLASDGPRFCFGKTVLYKIEETLPPLNMGGATVVGVKFVTELVDPHPFLFDQKSAPLRLKAPKKGKPALYPPEITTAMFHTPERVILDDKFRYGKYMNQK